jgi:hypothetical protein
MHHTSNPAASTRSSSLFREGIHSHPYLTAAILQVTPASYLELLTTFIKLLAEKRKDIGVSRQRLEAGLTKLLTTAAQVEVMQVKHHLHHIECCVFQCACASSGCTMGW